MISVGELVRRVWFFLRRDRMSAELEEEMRLHRELREARLREQGVSPVESRTLARRRFGNSVVLGEQSRDAWGLEWLDEVAGDVKFACRRLRHRPGFAVSTIAVTALGIGAATAVFSAVDAALLRPLPFARPSELVTLSGVRVPSAGSSKRTTTGPRAVDIRDVSAMRDVFVGAAAFAAGNLNLTDEEHPQRVRVGVVTPDFFPLLGAAAQIGRTFDAEEGRPDGPRAVILSNALWRARFGSADVIGHPFALNGERYTVIGVMKPQFTFPNESDIWIPLSVPTSERTFEPFRGYIPSRVMARFAPGVTIDVATKRMLAVWEQAVTPLSNRHREYLDDVVDQLRHGDGVRPLQNVLVGNRRTALLVLMGATVLLLLIACSNVANLLLSDAASRGREVALRGVLGANPARIVRQLLVESSLLALIGSAAGVALSPIALTLLRATMPHDLAGVAPVGLDVRVLIFATALALATGILFGLWPAIGTVRSNAADTIKGGGGGATSRLGRARRVLVTAELALTVLLLIGSGLMLRSLDRLMSQRLGMTPESVGSVELSFAKNRNDKQRLAILHTTLDRLQADPSVQGAGIVNDLPLGEQDHISLSIVVDGAPPAPKGQMRFARLLYASGGYFHALGIPVLRGRTFTTADDSTGPPVVIVNNAMAKKWWPNGSVLGRTIHVEGGDTTHFTIVGIVDDVREEALDQDPRPQMYFSTERDLPDAIAIVARSTMPAAMLLSRMRAAVRAADPAQPVYNVRTLESAIAKSVTPQRTNTTLITAFAMIALVLSAFGIYAVIAYSVSRRAREFGIRSALGATGKDIASLVGSEMLWIVLVGLGLGLAGAWLLAHVIASMLFGVTAHDRTTFVAVPFLLIIPAALATLIPTRRAVRVNPTEVMRAE